MVTPIDNHNRKKTPIQNQANKHTPKILPQFTLQISKYFREGTSTQKQLCFKF